MRFLMLNWRDPKNPLAGGAERVTLGYMSALAGRGHDVSWFAFNFEGADPEETNEGVRIIRRGGVWSAIPAAIRWTRAQPPFDLIIDQHHGIPWYAPWWSRAACVAYLHEVLGPIWDAFYRPPWNWIGKFQERCTHRIYRHVPFWTANQATKRGLEQHGVRNVTLIPYGVHTRALSALDPKPFAAPLRLIMVTRLAPNKRIDHAIEAVRCLRDRGIEASLTVVGPGEMVELLTGIARRFGVADAVSFTGGLPESDKDRKLQEAHLLLHTSQREGWGLNVIEGNALGTPAVAYPVDGLTESTLHEETGLVAASETPAAAADCIERMLKNPGEYQRFRIQAWERAKKFHWSEVLPKACDWLESQAAPKGSRRPSP